MSSRYLMAVAVLVNGVTAMSLAAPVPATKPAPTWEGVLAWLPPDTETLIVAPEGFEIPKAKAEDGDEKPDYALAIQMLPAGPLMYFKDGLLGKKLGGLKVRCAVEGSRRFSRPGELGLMPYEGCHILRFDEEADETLQKAIGACEGKADKTVTVAGVKVLLFTEQLERDKWSYFVCRPRPGVLMCATHRGFLEGTLERIDKQPTTRALAADLPEWKHVNVKAPIWGIRHYRKEFAKDDPTSPLCPGGSDPLAVGMVFWANLNVVEVRYLSRANDAAKIATAEWEAGGLKPKIKQGTPEVVEITTSLDENESAGMFLFVLMLRLGHAIVV